MEGKGREVAGVEGRYRGREGSGENGRGRGVGCGVRRPAGALHWQKTGLTTNVTMTRAS